MRVSNKQMVSIMKSDLFRNAEQLLKAQERVATRKLINRPSDDPIGMGKVLDYRKTISSIDQYNNNIVSAKNRTEFTDTLLENLHDLVDQAKRIVTEHSNQTDSELRQGAAQQVEGIYDQVLAIANTKYGDAYLFAGHQTDTQPFTECAAITCGQESDLTDGDYFTIGSGYYVYYDTNDDDALADDPADDLVANPGVAGRTGIRVHVNGLGSAAVASATMTEINSHASSDYTATVSLSDSDKVEIAPNPVLTCAAFAGLNDGDSLTFGPDYYVWYDKNDDSNGDPVLADRTGIRVNVIGLVSDDAVASATMTAINNLASSDYTATVSLSDSEKVEIVPRSVSYPDVVDVNTGFTTHDMKYVGDSGKINIIVGEGAQVRINLTGDDLFTGAAVASGTNVFDDLKALKDALEADPFVTTAVSDLADNLAKGVNQVEGAGVRQSITYRRLETTENHWVKFKDSVVNMLSRIEDADLASAIVELQAQETAYETALATAAKMFNRRSLIDFL